MSYLFYLPFALLPSFIWLAFFLRRDAHPESNSMIIRVFFLGMLVAVPAAFLEMLFFEISGKFNLSLFLAAVLNTFLGVALIEEALKYLVVRWGVLNNPEFDEPIDAVLYMIIAALGFAALENVLILTPLAHGFFIGKALEISAFRFLGATFLHALASGSLGYFLALSFYRTKNRIQLLAFGFFLAVLSHGLYNFSISHADLLFSRLTSIIASVAGINEHLIIPAIVLIGLAILLSFGFKKLKKLKSICLTHFLKN